MDKINPFEHHTPFQKYLDIVPQGDILGILKNQQKRVIEIFQSISDDKALYRYAESKWSIKELLGHIIDTEHVFTYRALCIGRHEKNPLPGYDQDEYVKNANFDDQTIAELLNQFNITRQGFIALYQSFTTEALQNIGIANNNHLSPKMIAQILVGHVYHHLNVLRDKYHITFPQ